MSATVSDVTYSSSQPSQGSGYNSSSTSYTHVITETIYPSATDAEVITTTITTGTPLPSTATFTAHPESPVPIGAIVGGAVGGVILAVAAVVIWAWWGRCIKRKRDKERKEILDHLQVKENTRRNAQSGSYTRFPSPYGSSRREKRVTFVSSNPVPSLPASRDFSEKEAGNGVSKAPQGSSRQASRSSVPAHKPVRPSPLGKSNPKVERAPLLSPTSPPTRPSLTSPTLSTPSSPVQPFLKRSLTHKTSAASSMSAYSTASGEERQKRVSTTLIMAALGHMDPRRSWLGNYLPGTRRSRLHHNPEASRLSQMSAASVYSQTDDNGEPIGYAYGGEEGPAPT